MEDDLGECDSQLESDLWHVWSILFHSTWLSSNWMKLVGMVASVSQPTDVLSNYLFLSNLLPNIATEGWISWAALIIMWAALAKSFTDFVSEVSVCHCR